MIKIEITDPHLMDKRALHETAKYLMSMAGAVLVTVPSAAPASQPVTPQPVPFPAEVVPIKNPETPPVVTDKTDETAGQLFTPAELQESEGLIEEAIIPVPPETVTAPAFNPFGKATVVTEENPDPNKEDTRGFKWDSRIHARTKTKNLDGTWRYQRGMAQDKIDRIEAEIRQVKATPPAAFVPPAPPAPPTAQAVPVAQAAPVAAPVDDFPALMSLITTGISTQGLKRDKVNEVLQRHGIPSLPVAASRPDLIPKIILDIKEVINAPR